MRTDENGVLIPLMLSELITLAQIVFNENGDMPVGVETCVSAYDDNEYHSLPVSVLPLIKTPRWTLDYWPGKFNQAFVIEGN